MQSTDHLALPWPFCKQTKTNQQQNETQIKMSIFSVNSCCAYLQYIIVTHTYEQLMYIHTYTRANVHYLLHWLLRNYEYMCVCVCHEFIATMLSARFMLHFFTSYTLTYTYIYLHTYICAFNGSTHLYMCVHKFFPLHL